MKLLMSLLMFLEMFSMISLCILMFQAMFRLMFLLPSLIKMKIKIKEVLAFPCHIISKKGDYMKGEYMYMYQTSKTLFFDVLLIGYFAILGML